MWVTSHLWKPFCWGHSAADTYCVQVYIEAVTQKQSSLLSLGLYPYVTGSANTNGTSERHGQINVKRRTSGKKNGVSHLHLFKKLSMLLFFLRAGKSRSYTSASKPSWSERRGVNMQANKATASTSRTTWKTQTQGHVWLLVSVNTTELAVGGLYFMCVVSSHCTWIRIVFKGFMTDLLKGLKKAAVY